MLPEGVQCEYEAGARKFDSKINKKSDENKKSKAQSSDTCFRHHKQGHWASEYPEGHEPEWLAKQNCFFIWAAWSLQNSMSQNKSVILA